MFHIFGNGMPSKDLMILHEVKKKRNKNFSIIDDKWATSAVIRYRDHLMCVEYRKMKAPASTPAKLNCSCKKCVCKLESSPA